MSEQTQSEQTVTAPANDGSEEAAVQALIARQKAPTSPQDDKPAELTTEAEPEDEPADESEAETEEGDPAEEESGEELVEVEFEGESYKLPPKLQKALLRQSDYSRRMNEVGEQRKTLTARLEAAEAMEKAAGEFSQALAHVHAIDARLKDYEGLDLRQLRQDNPAEFAAIAAEIQMLRMNKADAENNARTIHAKAQEAKSKDYAEQKAAMAKVLDKQLPGWRDKVGVEITSYALTQGYSESDLANLTDARVAILLDKARKFDAIQKGKAELKPKLAAVPPVIKPGAAKQVNRTAELAARFQESRSDDDAVALLMARRK